jgi:hypothetical protein
MGENGGNGHVRVEEYFDLEPNMLEEAVLHYLVDRGIKHYHGVQIEWHVVYNQGYRVPQEAIKNVSARVHLGMRPQAEDVDFNLMQRMIAQRIEGTLSTEEEERLKRMEKKFRDSIPDLPNE